MVAILDYNKGKVIILNLPYHIGEQSEDIEEYLTEELGYRLSDIHWMSGVINISINTEEL